MSKPLHHINYSFEDIERYLQGKMPPAEMHALEKAALQDPFLADAIEGYERVELSTVESDLFEIRQSLASGNEDTRVIPMRARKQWWKVAAMIILVAGAAVVGWQLMPDHSTRQEAAKESTGMTLSPPQKQQEAGAPVAKRSDASPDIASITKKPAGAAHAGKKVPDTMVPQNEQTLSRDMVAADALQSRVIKRSTDTATTTSINIAGSEMASNVLRGKLAELSVLNRKNERITNPVRTENARLSYVNGNEKPDSLATLAGFQKSVAPLSKAQVSAFSVANAAVVTGVGVSSNITTAGNVVPTVVMSPESSPLNEVVIVAPRSEKKKDLLGAAMTKTQNNDATIDLKQKKELDPKGANLLFFPLGEWEKFKIELRNKIRIFKKDPSGVLGDIELKLVLDKNGKAVEVYILKSYDASVNDLVIKAVKDYPRWRTLADGKDGQQIEFTIRL